MRGPRAFQAAHGLEPMAGQARASGPGRHDQQLPVEHDPSLVVGVRLGAVRPVRVSAASQVATVWSAVTSATSPAPAITRSRNAVT